MLRGFVAVVINLIGQAMPRDLARWSGASWRYTPSHCLQYKVKTRSISGRQFQTERRQRADRAHETPTSLFVHRDAKLPVSVTAIETPDVEDSVRPSASTTGEKNNR